MNYCYHLYRYREQEGGSLGLSALFLYIFLEWTYALFQVQTLIQGMVCVLGMLFGLAFGCIMIMAYLEICRKYTVSETGITLKYPLKLTVHHSWNEISEIGICNVHYTTRGPVEHLTAIRCVVGVENNGPSKGYGWWADSYYSVIHFRRIITIIYSDERLEEFVRVCPLEIVDYRSIKRY